MPDTKPTERPILFSGPMVQAILDEKKTQTRRVIKPRPVEYFFNPVKWMVDKFGVWVNGNGWQRKCPHGQPGDRLWVRETWAAATPYPGNAVYRATYEHPHDFQGNWKPSIHMPRWASRILLEITSVSVERIQDISEEDARAEGITDGGCGQCGESEPCGCESPEPLPVDSFIHLWNSINEDRGFGWSANPWVWVIKFKVIEAPK